MEQDGDAVVLAIAEAAGRGFEGLDLGVEAFGKGVGEMEKAIGVEELAGVSVDGSGGANEGRKATLFDAKALGR